MDVKCDNGASPLPIRPAAPHDYDQILALWLTSGLKVSTTGRESEEAFGWQLEQFPDLYLVATDGDRIVGVVLGTHDHRKGWINRLAVLPEYRRRGVASALVAVCEAAIHAQGIEIVTALIEPESAASAALFEKLGYRTDVPVRYFRKPNHPGV